VVRVHKVGMALVVAVAEVVKVVEERLDLS
jgi:hypothetical protein